MDIIKNLKNKFREKFDDTGLPGGIFAAPGRVNLIGEHTDYNDGFVLPMAIDRESYMMAQLRNDKEMRVYADLEIEDVFSIYDLEFDEEKMWVNYLKGVMDEFKKKGFEFKGLNLAFIGNIPLSSGLSSSAALEVVTAYTLTSLNNLEIKPVEMALLCQRAENNFVGVNCGIMDQYISRLGKKGCASMIDCRSNDYELVPISDEKYRIVISNSNVERGLVDSEYNKRRKECEKAADYFKENLDHRVEALRDVSIEEFNEHGKDLEEITKKRAKHVISENARVLTARSALENNDYHTFGKLMIESHESLRDDYEVSCEELDFLVELALDVDGVLGSRMTGAGFGGCTVSLVEKEHVDSFINTVKEKYQQKTANKADIYVTIPGPGARKIESI